MMRETLDIMKFPPEIRCMIWGLTLPGARVITIRMRSRDSFLCSVPIPLAMHICQESRREARKTLTLFSPAASSGFKPMYLDPRHDIIHIDMHDRFAVVSKLFPQLNDMHTIAFPLDAMDTWPWRKGPLEPCFQGMRRLLLFERKMATALKEERCHVDIKLLPVDRDFGLWRSAWRIFIEKHRPFGDCVPEIRFVVVKRI
ncbi:hypothetical protein CEP54_013058 [Fusarium duplospermum]|uniref:2EXR domain-containing protein n=1 Tax=Fusarium duplospermum TaxID=1325734 RepID=A0A428P555_9HYPO|nr:hypothetical protein CEP54_013058 [Fusarium duplospermum]